MYISNKAFVGLQSPSKVIFKENEKKRCKNAEEVKFDTRNLFQYNNNNNNNNNNHNNRLIPLGDVMYMDYMSLDLVKNQILDIIHHPCNNVTRKTNPTFTTGNIMKCMGSKLPQINKYWEK